MTVLEAERRDRGWSQTDLAFHAQTTQGEISRFERRMAEPRPLQAQRLSRLLGVPADALQREVREPGGPADDAPPVEIEGDRRG